MHRSRNGFNIRFPGWKIVIVLECIFIAHAFGDVVSAPKSSSRAGGVIAALRDPDAEVETFALHYLSEHSGGWSPEDASKLIDECSKMSTSSNPSIEAWSIRAISEISLESNAVDLSKIDLPTKVAKAFSLSSNPDRTTQNNALISIGNFAPLAEPFIDKLVPLLDSPLNSSQVSDVLGKLAAGGGDNLAAVADLISTRLRPEGDSLDAAIEALGALGPYASKYGAEITNFANSGNSERSTKALYALARIAPGHGLSTVEINRTIATILADDHSSEEQQAAAIELLSVAADLEGAFPYDLAKLLRSSHENVVEKTLAAIARNPEAARLQLLGLTFLASSPDHSIVANSFTALGYLGTQAVAISPEFLSRLQTSATSESDPDLRAAAIIALSRLDSSQCHYVPLLMAGLKDHDFTVRDAASVGLLIEAKRSPDIGGAGPSIARLLQFYNADEEYQNEVRMAALRSLGGSGRLNSPYLDQINDLLTRSNSQILKVAAIDCLKTSQIFNSNTVIRLRSIIATDDTADEFLKGYTIKALSQLPAVGNQCENELASLFFTAKEAPQDAALETLSDLAPLQKNVGFEILKASVNSENAHDAVRSIHCRFLVHLAWGGDPGYETLLAWLGSTPPRPPKLEKSKGYELMDAFELGWTPEVSGNPVLLSRLAEATLWVARHTAWTPGSAKDDELLRKHAKHLAQLNVSQGEFIKTVADDLRAKIDLWSLVKAHPILASLLAYGIAILGIYLTHPLLLLSINDLLIKKLEQLLPSWLGEKLAGPMQAILLFVLYRPRVLDAWVRKHVDTARREFEVKRTVNERKMFIPMPVRKGADIIPEFNPSTERTLFRSAISRILILGEGGSGKTTLACRFALAAMDADPAQRLNSHLMIPILMEADLGDYSKTDFPLFEAARRQLQELTQQSEPPSSELMEQLLRARRLLVIIDHFSELSLQTRANISLNSVSSPFNALLVTARNDTVKIDYRAIINTLRISGTNISQFVDAYLVQRGKRDLFQDKEFFDGCGNLSDLVGKRFITVLFAKLYVEYMIARTERSQWDLPPVRSIPELMLAFLNVINSSIEEESRQPNPQVHRDLRLAAANCMGGELSPGVANRSKVVGEMHPPDAEARLEYLEERLGVIQTIDAAEQQIRFTLDPLAEYLAALEFISRAESEAEWTALFRKVDDLADMESAVGFLRALADCMDDQPSKEVSFTTARRKIKELLESLPG